MTSDKQEPMTEDALKCDCRSYNWGIGTVPEVVVNAPDWSDVETICLDACIADTIQKLWERGLRTLNSCCGHGRSAPSVVIPHTDDPGPYHAAIFEIDPRKWSVKQWQLIDTRHEDIKAVDTHVCDEECGGAINMRHCDKAQAVDVEALKKDYCTCRDCQVWNSCIDHLAAHGHIAGRLPRIEGLEEAITDYQYARGNNVSKLVKAATEYAKRMEE